MTVENFTDPDVSVRGHVRKCLMISSTMFLEILYFIYYALTNTPMLTFLVHYICTNLDSSVKCSGFNLIKSLLLWNFW